MINRHLEMEYRENVEYDVLHQSLEKHEQTKYIFVHFTISKPGEYEVKLSSTIFDGYSNLNFIQLYEELFDDNDQLIKYHNHTVPVKYELGGNMESGKFVYNFPVGEFSLLLLIKNTSNKKLHLSAHVKPQK